MERALVGEGYRVLSSQDVRHALDLLALHEVQVLLSVQDADGMPGQEFLDVVRRLYPDTVRIVVADREDGHAGSGGMHPGTVYRWLREPGDDALREHVRDAFRQHQHSA
jgi:DNA-binding NtrC family response regulator